MKRVILSLVAVATLAASALSANDMIIEKKGNTEVLVGYSIGVQSWIYANAYERFQNFQSGGSVKFDDAIARTGCHHITTTTSNQERQKTKISSVECENWRSEDLMKISLKSIIGENRDLLQLVRLKQNRDQASFYLESDNGVVEAKDIFGADVKIIYNSNLSATVEYLAKNVSFLVTYNFADNAGVIQLSDYKINDIALPIYNTQEKKEAISQNANKTLDKSLLIEALKESKIFEQRNFVGNFLKIARGADSTFDEILKSKLKKGASK